ncbi:sensor histidine kinase TmoS [bacterium BMS3Abin07]|nr:sensor histidine kinase TmoS [bacterium BMS3Abin07]GBE33130.1 sensor histidine kinase TmoS [bacterium BMS3Bbin05]HDO22706.1 hybrid sensor histidine kinase/response regulator [Nitrospirota bacterium]HDZ87931.1 hybrid sensor histidine kinase/response regulator [Nitrospirota bacterium]
MQKILFIDDDPEIRLLIKSALKDFGEVLVAETGEEGIALAREKRPSLVLIDIMLPGLSGYDVVMKLRQIEYFRNIPIVAVTAYGGKRDVTRAKTLGFDEYIIKPFDILMLQKRIKGYLTGEITAPPKKDINPTVREYSIELIDRLQNSIEELQSEKKFRDSIIQGLSCGLLVLDSEEKIVTINPEGIRILDAFAEKIRGEKLSSVIGSGNTESMTMINRDGLFYRNELSMFTVDGEERIIGFTTVPRMDAAGKMVGIIISFRDITDIKRFQKEMEKMNRLSTMARVASAVAHEIRNPLAGIKTMTRSIEENIGDADNNRECIVRIIKQVDRLDEILRGFFTYSRPPRPRIKRSSLMEIIREVKPLVKKKLNEKGIVLEENYEKTLPDILVDSKQIQQVILDLMLNSIDAITHDGRIVIEAKTLQPAEREAYSIIFPELRGREQFIMMTLMDNGCGMPRGISEKIFEPFFTTKYNGSGLGLSIVYRILQENNAAIFVDSGEGAGTTFIIFFETEKRWERF